MNFHNKKKLSQIAINIFFITPHYRDFHIPFMLWQLKIKHKFQVNKKASEAIII